MAAQMRVDDIVTAFGAIDAPLDTAVATNGRSPYNATASGVTDEHDNILLETLQPPKRSRSLSELGTYVQRMTAIPQYDQSVQRPSFVES